MLPDSPGRIQLKNLQACRRYIHVVHIEFVAHKIVPLRPTHLALKLTKSDVQASTN
jgi:hypothetical protein